MTLINDYTYQAMTDQRERDMARLAENSMHVRLALSGRESWWRRMLSRREQRRIAIAAQRPADRGMATPQHRVAH
jgi:hypothetical protein